MKKSQLRHIIRESIKELNEQSVTAVTAQGSCSAHEFSWNGFCAQSHLHTAPGNPNSWIRFLGNRMKAFLGSHHGYKLGGAAYRKTNWNQFLSNPKTHHKGCKSIKRNTNHYKGQIGTPQSIVMAPSVSTPNQQVGDPWKPGQIKRKEAKIKWNDCMLSRCNCL